MQCPNCREIENGVWRRFENTNSEQDMDQEADEDEQHVFQTVKIGASLIYVYYTIPIYYRVARKF